MHVDGVVLSDRGLPDGEGDEPSVEKAGSRSYVCAHGGAVTTLLIKKGTGCRAIRAWWCYASSRGGGAPSGRGHPRRRALRRYCAENRLWAGLRIVARGARRALPPRATRAVAGSRRGSNSSRACFVCILLLRRPRPSAGLSALTSSSSLWVICNRVHPRARRTLGVRAVVQ